MLNKKRNEFLNIKVFVKKSVPDYAVPVTIAALLIFSVAVLVTDFMGGNIHSTSNDFPGKYTFAEYSKLNKQQITLVLLMFGIPVASLFKIHFRHNIWQSLNSVY